jgi:GntR family transcriptional regulator/MocR family aminotransferase
LPPNADDQALALQAAKVNLIVRPLSAYCLARADVRGLVIGYGYAPLGAIHRHSDDLVKLVRRSANP